MRQRTARNLGLILNARDGGVGIAKCRAEDGRLYQSMAGFQRLALSHPPAPAGLVFWFVELFAKAPMPTLPPPYTGWIFSLYKQNNRSVISFRHGNGMVIGDCQLLGPMMMAVAQSRLMSIIWCMIFWPKSPCRLWRVRAPTNPRWAMRRTSSPVW